MVIERFKKLFATSAELPREEGISPEDQRKIAEAVLADYQSIDVKRAVRVPEVVEKHFQEILNILDQHGVVDVKSLPVKGKGNRVDVPDAWGPSLIAVVNNVFDAKKWSGQRSTMRQR